MTRMEPINATLSVPRDMLPALRSDHAGETGAVYIYRGILAVTGDDSVRQFARHHLAAEEQHLKRMNHILIPEQRSRLLPVWRLAGWLTGALPAVFGATSVYRTIDAVESFVDQHYAKQIVALRERPAERQLVAILEDCRLDEVAHRDDARSRLGRPGILGQIWSGIVSVGSRVGVFLASRV